VSAVTIGLTFKPPENGRAFSVYPSTISPFEEEQTR